MLDLVKEIAQADGVESEKILNAVQKRYTELYPDWEIVMISIEKGVDRNEQLDGMITMLQNMKI